MYDKFRAVSSIQVILELCFPVLAIMGLQSFFIVEKPQQTKGILHTVLFGLGVMIILFVSKGAWSYAGSNDGLYLQNYGPGFVDALKADRMSLYTADLLRSAFFIVVIAVVLWLYTQKRLAQNTAIILVGILMIFDLFFVDKKYV